MRVALSLRTPIRATVVALVACLLWACSQIASAEHPMLQRGDEIYEVSVRAAGCTTNPERLMQSLSVRQLVINERGSGQWIESDWSQLTETPEDGRVTLMYVHGNKIDPCMARDRGLCVYRTLVSRDRQHQPIRFLIFSWNSTEIKGLLKDYRVKAARTRPVGWELGYLLNQMPADSRISLLGYSYGARIVGGATHLLAGGDLSGLTIADGLTEHSPMRVAFIAAATHAHWFGPRGYHGYAMNQIDSLMLLNNRLDPAMRFYSLVDKYSDPQAMGLCGPTCLTAEQRSRVINFECSKRVGRSHDLFKYISGMPTMTRVWDHLTYAAK